MTFEELRWGIAGCGEISHDFAQAMRKCVHKNKIVAVSARDAERAEEFKKKLELDESVKVYGNYEAMFNDPDVDVVYVGVVNHEHVSTSIKALESGKHVLCEKPIAPNVKEVKVLFEKAKETGKFLMEATWSRFFPVYKEIRQIIQDKNLGEVTAACANFGAPNLSENRFWVDKGQTPIVDIGSYTIQFALWAFGKRPEKITAVSHKNKDGCDIWTTITLEFPNGGKSNLICSAADHFPNNAFISFENGHIRIPEFFWCPTKLVVYEGAQSQWTPEQEPRLYPIIDDAKYNFSWSSGLRYEADHVYECLKEGRKQSDVHTHDESLMVLEVLDEVRRQIGVKYGQD